MWYLINLSLFLMNVNLVIFVNRDPLSISFIDKWCDNQYFTLKQSKNQSLNGKKYSIFL
jgi:hypothetical protein